jgi:hypothetical protein
VERFSVPLFCNLLIRLKWRSPLGSANKIKELEKINDRHAQLMFNIRARERDKWTGEKRSTPVEVDGKYRTIREVCWLLKRDTGELPDIIVGELMKAMRGDRRLLQQLGRTRTYATGSQCLLELLEERVRTFKGKR